MVRYYVPVLTHGGYIGVDPDFDNDNDLEPTAEELDHLLADHSRPLELITQ